MGCTLLSETFKIMDGIFLRNFQETISNLQTNANSFFLPVMLSTTCTCPWGFEEQHADLKES